jgi:hypothetical protein
MCTACSKHTHTHARCTSTHAHTSSAQVKNHHMCKARSKHTHTHANCTPTHAHTSKHTHSFFLLVPFIISPGGTLLVLVCSQHRQQQELIRPTHPKKTSAHTHTHTHTHTHIHTHTHLRSLFSLGPCHQVVLFSLRGKKASMVRIPSSRAGH